MRLNEKRFLIRLGIHGVFITLLFIGTFASTLSENASNTGFFAFLIIIYLATLRVNPLPKLLERRMIQDVECPHCGEIIDMVSVWTCGCGFVTWQPRHGLSACPDCGKVYDRFQCPRCDASIKT